MSARGSWRWAPDDPRIPARCGSIPLTQQLLQTSPRSALPAAIEAVKIVALAHGLQVDDNILCEFGGPAALTVHEYATTGGITLVLPGDVLVNAPFDSAFCERSALHLRRRGDALVLELEGEVVPVERVVPLPGYLRARDACGDLVAETTMSHADRIRISPIAGCAYDCRFCDLAQVAYQPRTVEQILRAIDIALKDEVLPARHLLISGGSPPVRNRRGQDYFEDVCVKVARHLREVETADGEPFEVDVMMSARPDGPGFVERMVSEGVAGFSLNVETYSEEGARLHLPLKHKWAAAHLEPMIVRAVELLGWGEGRVRSLIIPGLESVEQTLAGVEWLASLGCSPVLSPFRPAPGTVLEGTDPVSPVDLRVILDETRAILARHQVLLGPRCAACQHNTLSFPWDLRSVSAP